MKKFPKPWYRPSRGVWYVTLNDRQHNLGPDREAAFKQYGELLANPPKEEPREAPPVPPTLLVGLIQAVHGRSASECSHRYDRVVSLPAAAPRRSLEHPRPRGDGRHGTEAGAT